MGTSLNLYSFHTCLGLLNCYMLPKLNLQGQKDIVLSCYESGGFNATVKHRLASKAPLQMSDCKIQISLQCPKF